MKIGFFTDGYFPRIDGVAYTLELWRDRLEATGHEVWIIYPDGEYVPENREIPVRSLPNPFYPGYRFPLVKRPSSLPDLDIVHCHSPATIGLLGLYYAKRNGLPAIYTHHTPIEEYFQQSIPVDPIADCLSSAYVPLETAVLERFGIVTTSTGDIDRGVESVRLPVGVDMDFFSPCEPASTDGGGPIIGYTGRLSMEKNVSEILDVARLLPDCEFRIVGNGPRREYLEARTPDNVQIRDFLPRDSLPRQYTSLDVFVTASTADTLGLGTLEANACGTPVVAPDVPPFSETIGADNGVRFEAGNPKQMADAIRRCLDESWSPRQAVEPYCADRTIDKLDTLYRRARSA